MLRYCCKNRFIAHIYQAGNGDFMYYIWLVLAVACFAYYAVCAAYAGFGSSFIFIWLIAGAFFAVVFGVSFAGAKGFIAIPVWLARAFWCFMALGTALFIFLEGCVISQMNADTQENCDYIIVLGCQIRGSKVTKSLRKRLDKALEYCSKHPDTVVIVSGGKGEGEDMSEAEAMYNYLAERGVDESRIIKESQSYDTEQNMRYSARLIEDKTAKVGIVTSNFHVFRAKKLAAAKGLENVCAAAAASDPVLTVNYMVREAIGIIKDFVMGNFRRS